MALPVWWKEKIQSLQKLEGGLRKEAEAASTADALNAAISIAQASLEHVFTEDDSRRHYRLIKLPEIPVPIDNTKGACPPGSVPERCWLTIVFACWEEATPSAVFGEEALDRIRLAEFQVRVEGMMEAGGQVLQVQDHWRVDTHHFSEESSDPHPWVHFQRGGHALDDLVSQSNFLAGPHSEALVDGTLRGDWIGWMQSASPRLAAPPMDPVCAVDFALSQHSSSLWRRLWRHPEYSKLVRAAQSELWDPWHQLLADKTKRRRLMPYWGPPAPIGQL